MTGLAAPSAASVEHFRALIARRLGLAFDDGKLGDLAELLRQRAAGQDLEAYLQGLAGNVTGRDELRAVAERVTVGETYFFRNSDHFRALSEVVLPGLSRVKKEGRPQLRILSAGCASGEEAYTLAIVLRETMPDLASFDVSIRGVDVNAASLAKAARGQYSTWSLRGTPAPMRERYFRASGRDFVLDERVRDAVSFEERNLIEDDAAFWHPDAFDVVFCRNVTIYFPSEVTRALIARIARSVAPGGYLFIGHAETLRGISNGFHLRHTHETFYYQRREGSGADARSVDPSPVFSAGQADPAPPPALIDCSWIDAIRDASDRIATLARGSAASAAVDRGAPSASVATPPVRRPVDLGLALELLREERFADALDLLAALPPEAQADVDAQLLRAALLTNGGRLEEAQAVCDHIVSLDELNAGARYLLALCREHAGDRQAAVELDQTAAYLDPGFAMPRLHLGLLAKRMGDGDAARRELEQALVLLAREDASRILLFGGGFSRDTLVQLCRAELAACGGGS